MARHKEFKINWKLRFNYPLRLKLIKYYRQGYGLRELCKKFDTDISTVLEIVRKQKFKKKKLYEIYEIQDSRKETKDIDLILKKERYLLEKFFPTLQTAEFSYSYFWYWKEKSRQSQERKNNCKHTLKHIRCAKCSTILADASNLILEKLPRNIGTPDDILDLSDDKIRNNTSFN